MGGFFFFVSTLEVHEFNTFLIVICACNHSPSELEQLTESRSLCKSSDGFYLQTASI